MNASRPYSVYVYCGANPQEIPGARLVNITPTEATAASMIATISACGLTSADLRSRAVFVVDADASGDLALKSILAYTAMLGLARRRLDVAFGFQGQPIVMADLDAVARNLQDSGKPHDPVAMLHVSHAGACENCDAEHLVLGQSLDMATVTAVRFARRMRYTSPGPVAAALPQFIAMTSMRARGESERLPTLVVDGHDVELEEVRRASEALRRQLRGDDRSALAPTPERNPLFTYLEYAASGEIEPILRRLGAASKEVQVEDKDAEGIGTGEYTTNVLWHCPCPDNHTNADSTPSARVTHSAGRAYFRCFRCLEEKYDAVRLVMWVRHLTPIEAADWILHS